MPDQLYRNVSFHSEHTLAKLNFEEKKASRARINNKNSPWKTITLRRRNGIFYQYHACWWLSFLHHQAISSLSFEKVIQIHVCKFWEWVSAAWIKAEHWEKWCNMQKHFFFFKQFSSKRVKTPWLTWVACIHIHFSLVIGVCMDHILNTLKTRRNRHYFADDIFTYISLNENVWISLKIWLKFVPKGPINNNPALVWIMAWRRPGDKPLLEPMLTRFINA